MEDKKQLKVLLKAMQIVYDKNLGMQEVVDASMIEACPEEGVSPEQGFFIFIFICCCVYHKSVEDIKTAYSNSRESFSGNHASV